MDVNDLLYLLSRYTVQIAVNNENHGTSRDIRYYTATVSIRNSGAQLSATGFAHGTIGDDAMRQEAIQGALERLVRIAKAIEEAY